MSLGYRIKLKRKEKKLTQKQLADLLGGIDNSTVSKWESDTYEPDAASLNKLAEIFEVSTNFLISGEQDETDPEIRSLARDIQNLESGNRELLKKLIKSMSETGRKAKDE